MSIDDVTASFVTSLALASDAILDISHRSKPSKSVNSRRNNPQSFLLAKPLTPKRCVGSDLQRTFSRAWTLQGKFWIQERPDRFFVIGFDLTKDRNRVFWGGPWYHDRAPVIFQEYDGLAPIQSIPMKSLFFWVRISNIPPAKEKPDIIEDVAVVAGSFICHDDREWNATRKVRVRVEHDIGKPFIHSKTLKFAEGVFAKISYFYENLVGKCKKCNLIFHLSGTCVGGMERVVGTPAIQKENLIAVVGTSTFGTSAFSVGAFCFTGGNPLSSSSLTKPVFTAATAVKPRKPVVVRKENMSNAMDSRALVPIDTNVPETAELGNKAQAKQHEVVKLKIAPIHHDIANHPIIEMDTDVVSVPNEKKDSLIENDNDPPALVEVTEPALSPLELNNTQYHSTKQKLTSSPTKPATYFGHSTNQLKTYKRSKGLAPPLSAKALGLVHTPTGLKLKNSVESDVVDKKKIGRPSGARNKNPSEKQLTITVKVTGADVLSYLYSLNPPSPSEKGKEKV